jgi:hypothetical protein
MLCPIKGYEERTVNDVVHRRRKSSKVRSNIQSWKTARGMKHNGAQGSTGNHSYFALYIVNTIRPYLRRSVLTKIDFINLGFWWIEDCYNFRDGVKGRNAETTLGCPVANIKDRTKTELNVPVLGPDKYRFSGKPQLTTDFVLSFVTTRSVTYPSGSDRR